MSFKSTYICVFLCFILKSIFFYHSICIYANRDNTDDRNYVCLDDFDLLAVLGRGGFGKVMQVCTMCSDIR